MKKAVEFSVVFFLFAFAEAVLRDLDMRINHTPSIRFSNVSIPYRL